MNLSHYAQKFRKERNLGILADAEKFNADAEELSIDSKSHICYGIF